MKETEDTSPPRTAQTPNWVIVTFKKPLQWTRSTSEVWMFNPPRRYILNANQLEKLKPYIATISDLKTGRYYRPLLAGSKQNLHGSRILIERYRDRGVGDMLFMTGPMEYLRHISGATCKIDFYALMDRAQVLAHHPALEHESPLAGPVHYDDLQLYHYSWFAESVTEHDEEIDQLNVYDALYRQIGVEPGQVPQKYKRPSMRLVDKDAQDLDSVYYMLYNQRKVDLRNTPYYVVAPLTNATLRCAPYALWLQLIRELSKARPVVVVGRAGGDAQVPPVDMSFGQFHGELNQMVTGGANVFNLMGDMSIRSIASLISHAVCAVTLDSGLLYVAQALRVPAVSLWGTHAPQVRLGYDKAYMDLAIWPRESCSHSPCFAYAGFPYSKCPRGVNQRSCEVLASIPPESVIEKVTLVEKGGWSPDVLPIIPAAPEKPAVDEVPIFTP